MTPELKRDLQVWIVVNIHLEDSRKGEGLAKVFSLECNCGLSHEARQNPLKLTSYACVEAQARFGDTVMFDRPA